MPAPSTFHLVRATDKETDGQIFIPGSDFQFDVGTWTLTRGAAGNYFMRKTAAANTSNPSINITRSLLKKIGADPQLSVSGSFPHRTTDSAGATRIRGAEIKKIQFIYAIATDVLTTHTYDLHQTTYANNVAPSVVSTIGGTLTGTLATATQAQPYVTSITIGTPYIVGANTDLVADWFEVSAVATATCVYDVYGVFVDFNYVLL